MNHEDPLYVSVRNKRGVAVFFFICLLVIFFPRIIRSFSQPVQIAISKSKIADFKQNREKYYQYKWPAKAKKRFKTPQRSFNPNDYKKSDWMILGLSEKQANVVTKFTTRGIYSEEDLQKIFVIPDVLYKLIKDSIIYAKRPEIQKAEKEKKIIIPILYDLNTASENELMMIKGLGNYYAKAIVKYRNELGGFVRRSQLMEIFKMSNESYEKIIPHIQINPFEIRPLHINEATMEELNAHPYLNWDQANSIFKMRLQKNGYKSINEIKESHLINEETYDKLLPYLSL